MSQYKILRSESLELLGRIGRGGFGEVHKARLDGSYVAVKKLFNGHDNLPENAWENEVKILSKLSSQYIVQLGGIVFEDGKLWLVLEYCENGNCFDFFVNKRAGDCDDLMPFKFRTSKQICEGMQYLHANKVMHVDLKAPNVLLDKKYNVKICDFGLSNIKNTITELTVPSSNNSTGGTITHMPPERFKDNSNGPSFEGDVYSYGVLLFEIIAGKSAFKGFTDQQIAALVKENGHPAVSLKDIPDFFQAMIQKTWESADRRPSFNELFDMYTNSKMHFSSYNDEEIKTIVDDFKLCPDREKNADYLTLNGFSARSCSDNESYSNSDASLNTMAIPDKIEKVDNSEQGQSTGNFPFSSTEAKQFLLTNVPPAANKLSPITSEDENSLQISNPTTFDNLVKAKPESEEDDEPVDRSINEYTPLIANQQVQSPMKKWKSTKCKILLLIFTMVCVVSGILIGILQRKINIFNEGTCTKLEIPANGGNYTCNNSFKIGSKCKFICPNGFKLSTKTDESICLHDKTWSQPLPYCVKEITCHGFSQDIGVSCINPTLIKGNNINEYSNGTVCTFSCQSGMEVYGDKTLICLRTGSWNGTEPVCKRACAPLNPGKNIHMNCTNGWLLNSKCNFTCEKNFVRVGNPNLNCVTKNTGSLWTSPIPHCYCPACSTGEHCQYSLQWTEAANALNKSLSPVKSFYYGSHKIQCSNGTHSTCRCKDLSNNKMQDCSPQKDEKFYLTCQRALSSLILMLVDADPTNYELPCDAFNMPPSCKYS